MILCVKKVLVTKTFEDWITNAKNFKPNDKTMTVRISSYANDDHEASVFTFDKKSTFESSGTNFTSLNFIKISSFNNNFKTVLKFLVMTKLQAYSKI